MLEILTQVIKDFPKLLKYNKWESLVINRRKPHTYRAFTNYGQYRVCLHRFAICEPEEAFMHPHAWPAAFRILKGSYSMALGYSTHRDSHPSIVARIELAAGSSYEMNNPLAWHSITPLQECYTIMVNDKPWPETLAHTEVKTTKGKDLKAMTEEELKKHLDTFNYLINGL